MLKMSTSKRQELQVNCFTGSEKRPFHRRKGVEESEGRS